MDSSRVYIANADPMKLLPQSTAKVYLFLSLASRRRHGLGSVVATSDCVIVDASPGHHSVTHLSSCSQVLVAPLCATCGVGTRHVYTFSVLFRAF